MKQVIWKFLIIVPQKETVFTQIHLGSRAEAVQPILL